MTNILMEIYIWIYGGRHYRDSQLPYRRPRECGHEDKRVLLGYGITWSITSRATVNIEKKTDKLTSTFVHIFLNT